MRYFAIILTFIGFCNSAFGQYENVDATVASYPAKFASVADFAQRVKLDFKDGRQQARAIFTWISSNIVYDVVVSQSGHPPFIYSYRTEQERVKKEAAYRTTVSQKTLDSGKAICDGYCLLFEETCRQVGLEAASIIGHLKVDPESIGEKLSAASHGWNAVKIDNKWQLVDATLAAGYVSSKTNQFVRDFNPAYFGMDPQRFELAHFSLDPKWNIGKTTSKDFENFPVFFGNFFSRDFSIDPLSGLLSKRSAKFGFTIAGLTEDDGVAFWNNGSSQHIQSSDDKGRFEIETSSLVPGVMILYIGGKPTTAYKVIP